MKFTSLFALLALTCLWYALRVEVLPARIALVVFGATAAALSLAYMLSASGALLKTSDGRMQWYAWALLWPYLLANVLLLFAYRLLSRENWFDEIIPGIYLGGRPGTRDKAALTHFGITSVLDATGEFPETAFVRGELAYRGLPLLDTQAPSQAQLRDAVAWLTEQCTQGALLVHCALGHGRSATFVAAYLLATRHATSAEEAVKQVQAARPGAKPNVAQMAALEAFMKSVEAGSEG